MGDQLLQLAGSALEVQEEKVPVEEVLFIDLDCPMAI
jgi:hypothetical protein